MATYNGTSARNIWSGSSTADTARGIGGDDSLYGKAGNDTLYGDAGNDGLYGDAGNDKIYGGDGVDALFGGDGNDALYGGAGNDYISGGAGNNKMFGDAGNDTLVFTHRSWYANPDGSGVIDGGAGYDTLVIDAQGAVTEDLCREVCLDMNSTTNKGALGIVGDHAEPTGLWFGNVQSIEEIRATPGSNPVAIQVAQNMKVTGGPSADFLYGGNGDQLFIGGAGADTFRYEHFLGSFGGNDEIDGFSLAQGDRVQFYDADPRITTKAVEAGGHTIYTTTDSQSGQVLHTLDVDAIGLPPIGHYEIA